MKHCIKIHLILQKLDIEFVREYKDYSNKQILLKFQKESQIVHSFYLSAPPSQIKHTSLLQVLRNIRNVGKM